MENYAEALKKQEKELKELLKLSEKNLSKLKGLPEYRVRSTTSNGTYQYYLAPEEGGKYKYADRKQRKLVERLVQKEYETDVRDQLQSMLRDLERFLKAYNIENLTDIYENLPGGKRKLVMPILEPNDDFIAQWREQHIGGQNPYYGEGDILTARGESVRSKSEKIIADLLDKNGIPYAYETELRMKNGRAVYPDFAVLNVRLRKTILWEHMGLIDDEEYAIKNLHKIREYERSGYELGDNLILTMESSADVIRTGEIEEKIRKYCL